MPRLGHPPRTLDEVKASHLSVGRFARFLGVQTRQLWKWRAAGLIEIVVLGDNRRLARIHIDECRRFYNSGRTSSCST